MDTFNKIWIVPETTRIYEHAKGAFIVESHLKVSRMLCNLMVFLDAHTFREKRIGCHRPEKKYPPDDEEKDPCYVPSR